MRTVRAIALTLAAASPLLARQPVDVDIIVRDAARQRASLPGNALTALARESGRLDGIAAAWSDFAAELGWSTAQTFDAVLGSRVMLVLRDVGPGGARHWALISEVTRDAETRLVSALRPAPRGTAGGYTVLAIERGRYELAIARGGWRDDAARPAVILLTPADDRALFDELVPTLDRARFDQPRPGDPADAEVVIRRPAPPAFDGGPAITSVTSLTARIDQAGWTFRLLGDPGSVGTIEPWSTGAFEGLQEGAAVAVMGVLGAPPLTGLGQWFGIPNVALPPGSALGPRVGLVVYGGAGITSPPLAATGVRLAAHAQDTRAPLCVSLAIEARDLPALIPQADNVSASLVPFLSTGHDPALPAAVEFDSGLRERSVRAVEIFPAKGSLAAGFGPGPVFTWAFGRSRPTFAQLAGVKTGVPAGTPGWWVMSLAPADAARAATPTESVRDLLSREMPDPLQTQRLSVGVVRPAQLQSVPGVPPDLADALRGARWVESVRWDSWLRPDGRAEGEIRLRMNPRP